MWHSVTHLAHLMSRKIRCCTTGMMQIKPHTHPLSLHHHYASSGIMHLTSSIQMLKVNYPMNQTVNVYNSLTFPDYNYHEIIAKKYGYEEILRSCFIVYCTFIDIFYNIFICRAMGAVRWRLRRKIATWMWMSVHQDREPRQSSSRSQR